MTPDISLKRVSDVSGLMHVLDVLQNIGGARRGIEEVRYWLETYHKAIRLLVEDKPFENLDQERIVRDVVTTEGVLKATAIPRAYRDIRRNRVTGGGDVSVISLILMGFPLVLHRYVMAEEEYTVPVYQNFTELQFLIEETLASLVLGDTSPNPKRVAELVKQLPDSLQQKKVLEWKTSPTRTTFKLNDITLTVSGGPDD